MTNQPLLNLSNVSKIYLGIQNRPALDEVSLTIAAGEFVAIVGRSGSGKSTLFNLIGGLDQPTSGEVHVSGQRLSQLTESQLTKWRGREVGLVFQFFQLIPSLTAFENVLVAIEFVNGRVSKDDKLASEALLKRVGLEDHMHKRPAQMSGGQQQRVAIARALANEPRLLLADEPTGNLDSKTTEEILVLLEDLAKEGRTVLVITHDATVAARAKRVITLRDGTVESDDKDPKQ